MREHVKIRRQGKFYTAYEDDAYVLHAIADYKISKGRVGFPVNSLGKIQNMLVLQKKVKRKSPARRSPCYKMA